MLCSSYLPFLKNTGLHTANKIPVIPKFLEALNWDHCRLRLRTVWLPGQHGLYLSYFLGYDSFPVCPHARLSVAFLKAGWLQSLSIHLRDKVTRQ